MSHFTVAINEVLERMKETSGITRQQFAARIGMSLSTLSSYTTARSLPNAGALDAIASGLEERDAFRLIVAHLTDETPAAWLQRLALQKVEGQMQSEFSLAKFNFLPRRFLDQVEAIVAEGARNEHVIAFIDEFATLLGLAVPAAGSADRSLRSQVDTLLCPPPGKIKHQPVPAGIVHAPGRSGSPTPSLNEAPPASPPSKGKKLAGPRAPSTKGIREIVRRDRPNPR